MFCLLFFTDGRGDKDIREVTEILREFNIKPGKKLEAKINENQDRVLNSFFLYVLIFGPIHELKRHSNNKSQFI